MSTTPNSKWKDALEKKNAISRRLRKIRKRLISLDVTYLDDAILKQEGIKLTTLDLEDESKTPGQMFYRMRPISGSEASTVDGDMLNLNPIQRCNRAQTRRIDYTLNQIIYGCEALPEPWVATE
ncbi:hypothetical protein BDV26DRAFT_293441 [Aspergillus bertholletiae]|uniref:Uncharacterized protein n=1 Tax=Aspergillus bertholletiae TaxID=1226010 RepID=A0A5N7B6R5_9EURO|nr:hypothetical protein BDV26DRAFT_293441 [Aspergillus bertholletiae]